MATVKAFVVASNTDKPGIFYEYFVPVATSAHALAVYSDEITADPDFDSSKKTVITSAAELVRPFFFSSSFLWEGKQLILGHL